MHKSTVATAHKYRDKKGVLRYHGLPALKGTQFLGMHFFMCELVIGKPCQFFGINPLQSYDPFEIFEIFGLVQ